MQKGCIAARKYTDRIGVYERNLPTSKAFGMSPLKTGRPLTSPRQAQIEKTVSATQLFPNWHGKVTRFRAYETNQVACEQSPRTHHDTFGRVPSL